MDNFKHKCLFVIASTQRKAIKDLAESVLLWHETFPAEYPTEKQELLIEGFFRHYSGKIEKVSLHGTYEA